MKQDVEQSNIDSSNRVGSVMEKILNVLMTLTGGFFLLMGSVGILTGDYFFGGLVLAAGLILTPYVRSTIARLSDTTRISGVVSIVIFFVLIVIMTVTLPPTESIPNDGTEQVTPMITPTPILTPTPTIISVSEMITHYPIWCTFNILYNDVEYAGDFKMFESGSCTMIMRGLNDNKVWHANWELFDEQNNMNVYKLWGRDGTITIYRDGTTLIKGTDIPETTGAWKLPYIPKSKR